MKAHHQIVFPVILAFLSLWGCRSSEKMVKRQSPASVSAQKGPSPVNYTLIYIVHGDASYLYHDEQGHERQSDEQVVAEAKSVARNATHGEVFIFHQKPEKKILGIFPQKDRQFLHYINGKRKDRKKYSPASSTPSFVAEQQLYEKYSAYPSARKVFLYYGHEVPQPDDEITYSRSRPDAAFNTETFAKGMRSFLDSNDTFDLTVLSTCDNGTPSMVSRLEPYTNYLLASPQNLHLSQIDSEPLLELEDDWETPALKLAKSVAKKTFGRLSDFIQTAVTLTVYDMQEVSKEAEMWAQAYRSYRKKNSTTDFNSDNTDCANLTFRDPVQVSKGVKKYYKRARFGRKTAQKSYSGWGCRE